MFSQPQFGHNNTSCSRYVLVLSEAMIYKKKPDRPHSSLFAHRALGDARAAMIVLQMEIRPGAEYYKALAKVVEAIDDVAEIETGDRTCFWTRPHGTP